MNLSMKWLKDYVDIGDMPMKEYTEGMTMSGSKVEGYKHEGEDISNVVVGKLLSVDKVPDSDHLVYCMVEVGADKPIQIVTGAPNITPDKVGRYIPCALDGSLLPNGVKIKKGKIRGMMSNGMMCSLGELGLTQNDFPGAVEGGIFILDGEYTVGERVQDAIGLNDTTVEFEITSNRPDCLSVIGLARETAATFDLPLNIKEPVVKGSDGNVSDYLSVEVENTTLCSRYAAAVVTDVKTAPSPRWLRERLRASGVRPINNLVDITNYVMLEYGHPMHAFDLRYVSGSKIVVRNAKAGESITTLDGNERALSPEMLVIADADKPVAVAGVMGGEYSGIMEDTSTVVFESACFSGVSVRKTAQKLGMRTDASSRFEKGIDAQNCYPALMRACQLVEELGAGKVVSGIIDADYSDKALKRIKLEVDWTNRFLGIELSEQEMVSYLKKLGFGYENGDVIVPSIRIDCNHKADIAEEVARIYGYNNIPTTPVLGSAQAVITPKQHLENDVVRTMVSLGFYEVATYSFISPKYYDKILLPTDSNLRKSVIIRKPLGEDTSVMRTTALPSILEVLARNYSARNLSAKFFELATQYTPLGENELPLESLRLMAGLYGENSDFFTLKGAVEVLLSELGIKDVSFTPCKDDPSFHSGKTANVLSGERLIGILGEIHPTVLDNYDIDARTYVASLDFAALFECAVAERTYKPLPKYPSVRRDLSILCDDKMPVAELEEAIRKGAGKLLEDVNMFDFYKGKQVEAGMKSVSYAIILRSQTSTLTDEQSDKAVAKCLKELEKLGAKLRA